MVRIMEIKDVSKNVANIGSEVLDLSTKVMAPKQTPDQSIAVTTAMKSGELNSIEAFVDGSVPFNSDKVSALKSLIYAGQFKIQPGVVATGMILTAQLLIVTNLTYPSNAA
jgi:anti-sigma28 factor (negative regulator of flagellin synthesis)